MQSFPEELRRRPEDCFALYSLNPTLRDIYVEGPADKALLEDLIPASKEGNTKVRTADTIAIPSEILLAARLSAPSNRSKIIYLAHYLSGRGTSIQSVLCIADRDLEHFFPCPLPSPLLALTDFGSMELYFFDEGQIDRFLRVGVGILGVDASALTAQFAQVLVFLTLVHIVTLRRGWRFDRLPFSKDLVIDANGVRIDETTYCTRFLNKIGQRASFSSFTDDLGAVRNQCTCDRRMIIRGHDFSELLYRYCASRKPRCRLFHGFEGIEACLRLACDRVSILGYPLFVRAASFAISGHPTFGSTP